MTVIVVAVTTEGHEEKVKKNGKVIKWNRESGDFIKDGFRNGRD